MRTNLWVRMYMKFKVLTTILEGTICKPAPSPFEFEISPFQYFRFHMSDDLSTAFRDVIHIWDILSLNMMRKKQAKDGLFLTSKVNFLSTFFIAFASTSTTYSKIFEDGQQRADRSA